MNIQRIPLITASAVTTTGCIFNDKDFHSLLTTLIGGTLMFLLSHLLQWAGHKLFKNFPHVKL